MRLELENRLEDIPSVIASLEEFGGREGLTKSTVQAGELSLDELLTNIISYAYTDVSRHSILIDMAIEGGALKIVVSDDGIAFNPFEHVMPSTEDSVEQKPVGGVGIHLVKSLMDQCSYGRENDRNVVTLLKSLD